MHRRIDPIRQENPLHGRKRDELLIRYRASTVRLDQLDAQLQALSAERQQVMQTHQDQGRRLYFNRAKRGRQPLPDGSEALPEVHPHPLRLWGRRLRSVCLALLRAHQQPMTLIDLHAQIHRRGAVIDSTLPVKALADALGYETRQGRAYRTGRGIYQLVPSPTPAKGRHGNPTELAS